MHLLKPRRFARPVRICALPFAALFAVSASAGTLYWDINGSTAGAANSPAFSAAGTWGSGSPWTTDSTGLSTTIAYVPGSDVVFSAGTNAVATTVTLSGTQTANSLTFEEGLVNITSGTELTLIGSAQVTAHLSTNTISSAIGGTVGLTKLGAGNVTLSGANTYSGATAINAGSITVAAINDLSTNGILGNSASAITLGASGTTGTLKYTGATLSTNRTFALATGGSGALFVESAAASLALTGALSGSGSFIKDGLGLLTLSSTGNSYSGGTTIRGGTLAISATSGTPLGQNVVSNTISIGAGANLTLAASSNRGSNQGLSIASNLNALGGYGVAFTPGSLPVFTNNTSTYGGVYGINYTGSGGVSSLSTLDTAFNGYAGGANGHWYLGSQTTGTYNGASLGAASDATYRLGGGGGSLTFSAANVITGANDVIINSKAVNGGGTVTFAASQNYSGTTTLNTGALISTASSGTPFGTGNVVLNAGTMQIAPSTSGANSVSGVSALAGSTFTYGGGGTLQLTKNGASLTYTIGNASPSGTVLSRAASTKGTLVLATTAVSGLGSTEKLVVNGLDATANKNGTATSAGIYDATVVAQEGSGDTGVGTFIVADTPANGGFRATLYTTAINATTVAAGTISDVTANLSLNDTSNPYALRVGAVTLTNAGTTKINGTAASGTNSGYGGLILNPTSFKSLITGGTLDFGASEGVIYVGAGAGFGEIASAITGSAGLTKFGPGTLRINRGLAFTGGTRILAGTLMPVALAGSANFNVGGSLTMAGGTSLIPDYGGSFCKITDPIILTDGFVTFNASNAAVNANADIILTGGISGNGGLIITGQNNSNRRKVHLVGGGSFTGGVILRPMDSTTSVRLVISEPTSLGTGTLRVEYGGGTGSSSGVGGGLEVPNGNASDTTANTPLLATTGVANPIDLAPGANLNITTSATTGLKLTGTIFGPGSITTRAPGTGTTGPGTLTLAGNNTYTGGTNVPAGIIKAGVASVANVSGAFGNNSAVYLANSTSTNGSVVVTMDITGFDTQIGSLTGGGASGGNVTLGAATLTLGGDNTNPATYAGVISGSGGSVTKIGTGTQPFSGNNTYTGNTTVSAGKLLVSGTLSGTTAVSVTGGTLEIAAANRINDAATVTMSGGTFKTGGLNETLAAFTLSGTAAVDLGAGASILNLANSSAQTWSGALNITNWSGSVSGGGTDQIYFGTDATGLTGGQLALITFVDPLGFAAGNYFAAQLGTGELVPSLVPEPGAAVSLLGGLAMLLGLRRRRS